MSTTGRTSLPWGLLSGDNAAWVDAQYRAWLADPGAVDPAWARLFEQHVPPADPRAGMAPAPDLRSIFAPGGGQGGCDPSAVMEAAERQAKVMLLVNAFRVRGHTEANIDPLGRRDTRPHPELTLEYYGLGPEDLDVPVSGRGIFGVPPVTTLRHIITRMRKAYCGGFGVEFMNIGDPRRKAWLQERFETVQDRRVMSKAQCLKALRQMADAQHFEAMLHRRFPGTKRFSLEGAETLIPLLDDLIEALVPRGIEMIVLGMAHRGRLNVLANIVDKPVPDILAEFEDRPTQRFSGSGDVKYHLGYTHEHTTSSGQQVVLSLTFNPSHLEAVDPVVEGRCRAVQDRRGDTEHARSLPILIHGDAAFAGQGLVAETLNLSGLRGYRTGGTIHVIVNNQIGFTTAPSDARSTDYCTDVARMLQVPIFHVNGEDPDAVATVAAIAAEWRQTFRSDCVIDMYCYRKYGHNEGDEPSFTQPLLYDLIRNRPTPLEVYAETIARRYDDIDESEIAAVIEDSRQRLEEILNQPAPPVVDSYQGNAETSLGRVWSAYRQGATVHDPVDTTVDRERLVELLQKANTLPDGFHAHRKIQRLLAQRREMARGERPVDWAVGEQAAYATLVAEGHPVRLSGQDSGRGTFSHRHAVLTDVKTGEEYVPLCHLDPGQARFQVYDSMLSEAGVLGFEFGYTLDYPETLVLWEAQFGDFANGAQIIIDNFIMATEQKWDRCSGLVMLLPHGYEGQGPEHSSARLERFLQLCAEENIVVANCTTPANFFHLLRRQVLWRLRKPLIHLSPKSLLRHPRCTSTLDELASGRFRRVLEDPDVPPEQASRLIFCSGKVFYDLQDARGERRDVSIARLEQLYPFPADRVQELVRRAGAGTEIVWCQEEPRNMGAWPMMDEWMTDALGERPTYAGRPPAASPATGSPRKHRQEQAALLEAALEGPARPIALR
ncbi:MAG: 2-oxoglutarate dehydrogenase E1 component [Deltaproteobacteria bacterium]|nr:MAG: 2-oxoglutarate dehydrogenase E1 component [Deltaproteobacteria bacterium]